MKKYLFTLVVVIVNFKFTQKNEIFSTTTPSKTLQSPPPNGTTGNDSIVSIGQIHSATWYNMHGHKTASGQRFHKDSLTAAYNYAKFGDILKVTNITNGLSVFVKVTDRMGNKTKNRIDLSKSAFDSIGNPSSGRLNVKVEKIIER